MLFDELGVIEQVIQLFVSEVETLWVFLHTSILALLDASIHFSYVILIAIFHSLRIQVSIFNYALLLKEKEVEVEVEKEEWNQGKYLQPDLYGQPNDKKIVKPLETEPQHEINTMKK